ncbi:hypothetical protein, partial [Tenacibaculum xiamenense]|uniref:hypothetical protein n=1 Tax=Tenacibaculum xiamenense TaxID=1261553 RepID=UPI0038B5415D
TSLRYENNELKWDELGVDVLSVRQEELWAIEDFNTNITYQYTTAAYDSAKDLYVTAQLREYFDVSVGFDYVNGVLQIPTGLTSTEQTLASNLERTYIDEFEQGVSACETSCNTTVMEFDGCDIGKSLMLLDVSPGGQYGSTDPQSTDWVLSVFNDTDTNVLGRATNNSSLRVNWRYPLYDSVLGGVLMYADENGDRSKIEVIDGQPEALTASDYFEEDGKTWIYPEDLKNLEDFLGNWQESWAKSLLFAHAEAEYYKFKTQLCSETFEVPIYNVIRRELEPENRWLTSDEFDSYITEIKTYDGAKTALLLGADKEAIFNRDPYFNLMIPGVHTHTENDKKIMQRALNTQYEEEKEGHKVTMIELAYITNTYNGLSDPITIDGSSFNISKIEAKSEAVRNKIWETYKAYYLGLKQRIIHVFMNDRAAWVHSYNGCIGEAPSGANYTHDYTKVLSNYSDLTPEWRSGTNKYCHGVAAWETKEKRFPPVDLLYDSQAANSEDVLNQGYSDGKHDQYVQTGKCPLAHDLEYTLDGLVNDKVSSGPNALPINNLNQVEYKGQYITRSVFEGIGGVAQPRLYLSSDVQGTELSLKIETNEICKLDLSGTGYQWSNYNVDATTGWVIQNFEKVYYTHYETSLDGTSTIFHFKVLARALVNRELKDIILRGTTSLAIGECHVSNGSGGGTTAGVGEDLGLGDGSFSPCPGGCDTPTGVDGDNDGVDDGCDVCPPDPND